MDRLARIRFWGLLSLYVLFSRTGGVKYLLLHSAESVCGGEQARVPLPFFGGNVERSTAQKKEGRDGTIWGDDKKVLRTDDDSLGGPLKFIYLFFYLFHLVPFPVRFILRCVPPRLGVVDFRGRKKRKSTGRR